MDDDAKSTGRADQATKLALLIKAYRTGLFRARTDDERLLLAQVDQLLNPSGGPARAPRADDLAPLGDNDYLRIWDGLQQRVDLLEDAWRRGMAFPETADQSDALAEVERVLGSHCEG